MAIKTISDASQQTLFLSLAKELADFLERSKEKHLVVALPGGRSVVGLLSALTSRIETLSPHTRERLQFFMLDERVVPLDSPDSNFKLLREGFFNAAIQKGLISQSQLHPFDISKGALPDVIEGYGKELGGYGGSFTAAVLGVGEDAHIGALFPGHHSITDRAPLFMTMTDSPKPPPLRMTASRALISQTRFAVALFIGEAKREALQSLTSDVAPENAPVALLRQIGEGIIGTDLTV